MSETLAPPPSPLPPVPPPPTAPSDVTESPSTTTEETYPVHTDKLTILGDGKNVGRTRTYDEDNDNLADLLIIQEAQQVLERTQRLAQDNTSIAQTLRRKDTSDITRATQKLQQRCNHSYSEITNRCAYCNKHRNSHVYDLD